LSFVAARPVTAPNKTKSTQTDENSSSDVLDCFVAGTSQDFQNVDVLKDVHIIE
jgi:hypothetical protein